MGELRMIKKMLCNFCIFNPTWNTKIGSKGRDGREEMDESTKADRVEDEEEADEEKYKICYTYNGVGVLSSSEPASKHHNYSNNSSDSRAHFKDALILIGLAQAIVQFTR
jgi:hypothetical protein